MTTSPLEPGSELVVTAKPPRRREVPRLGWAALVAVGLGLAAIAVLVGVLLIRQARSHNVQQQLACQVEQLGGRPVGGVVCPPKAKTSPVPLPSGSTRPPDVIVVMPPSSSSAPTVTVVVTARPAPGASSGSPAPRPSPSPSGRATPSPSPLVQICPPGLPCFPRTDVPRPRSELLWPPCRR